MQYSIMIFPVWSGCSTLSPVISFQCTFNNTKHMWSSTNIHSLLPAIQVQTLNGLMETISLAVN